MTDAWPRYAHAQVRSVIVALRSGVPISGDGAQITWRPQSPFRGTRIAVPDAIAPLFEIDDLKVGNVSQFPTHARLAADLFAMRLDQQAKLLLCERGGVIQISIDEAATAEFGRAFAMATCQTAADLTLCVSLRAGARPTEFEAYILGTEARW